MINHRHSVVASFTLGIVAAAALTTVVATPAVAQSICTVCPPPPPPPAPPPAADPTVHGRITGAGIEAATRFLRRLDDRGWATVAGRERGGGGADATPSASVVQSFRAWTEAYGVETRLSDQGAIPGERRRANGFIAGIGAFLGPDAAIGIAVDSGVSHVDVAGIPQHGRLAMTQIGINAAYQYALWSISVSAIYGAGDVGVQRGDGINVSSADYGARVWGGIGEIAYNGWSIDDWRIVPKLGADWTLSHSDGFTETGGADPVTGTAQESERARAWLGLEVGRSFSSAVAVVDLSVYGRVVDVFYARDQLAEVTSAAAPTARLVQVANEGSWGVDWGAAASVQVAPMMRFYAVYDGRYREHADSHGGTLGVELRW